MTELEIVPATRFHAVDLAPRLRQTDVQELAAVSPDHPTSILVEAVDVSSLAFAALREGRCHVLGGAAPFDGRCGSIWLLASDDIYKWRKEFMKWCRHYLDLLHEEYDVLFNFVDDRNKTSQAWLRRLGFIEGVKDPEHGIAKLPFTQFSSRRCNHVQPDPRS